MPGTAGYSPDPESDLWKANDRSGKNELQKRRAAHQKAWKYYDGQHKKHLKPDAAGRDTNVTLNKIGQLVDGAVSSLIGVNDEGQFEGVRFDVVDESGEQSLFGRVARLGRRARGQVSREQEYLDQVWLINQRALFQHNVAMNGAVCGHCFVRIVPRGIYYWPQELVVPRLINLDPSSVTVFWDQGDVGRPLFYRLEFGEDGSRTREDIVRDVDDNGDDKHGWTIHRWKEIKADKSADSRWVRDGEPETWGHPWSPIIEWPNLPRPNLYYGRADIGGAIDLNDGLNFTASNFLQILKYHAHPRTIGLGFEAKQIQSTSVDGMFSINVKPDEASVFNLEMESDLGSSLAFLQLMVRSIFDEGRELDPQSVQDKLGDLTNFALRVLSMNMTGKVASKRGLYGDHGFTRINQALLDLGDLDKGKDVVNQWTAAVPLSQLEQAQALEIDRRHGASKISYLERRGYDPETEAERKALEVQTGQTALADLMAEIDTRGGFGL
jgi:hypothetical protein